MCVALNGIGLYTYVVAGITDKQTAVLVPRRSAAETMRLPMFSLQILYMQRCSVEGGVNRYLT